jgi:putative DNA primase/helicase
MSVDIEAGCFYDHEAEVGGGVVDLVRHKRQCDHPSAITWLRREGYFDTAFGPRPQHTAGRSRERFICGYDYRDEDGKPLFQVIRYEPKTFKQRRPGINPGDPWIWNLEGVRRVLYRLPELIEALALERPVFVVEGEKDADALCGLNIAATCNPGGSGKWREEYSERLAGAEVIIVPDNDEAGRTHARQVATSLSKWGARVRWLDLPNLPEKGDISDWLALGGTREQLDTLVGQASEWRGAAAQQQDRNTCTTPASGLYSICAADVKLRHIDFIWANRLARGKHTCFAGEGGLGKSQLLIAIIAVVTTGGEWPCNEGRAPLGNAVILNAEDRDDDTLVPRLMAAGADLKRVRIIKAAVADDQRGKRRFNLQTDLPKLKQEIENFGDVLIVGIDPVSSYMGAKLDSHNNTQLRAVLDPITDLAEETEAAFVSVTHFNKGGAAAGVKAIHRVMGGAAFTHAPRAAFAVIQESEDRKNRLFLPLKTNLGPEPQGLRFGIGAEEVGIDHRDGNPIWATHVVWDLHPVTTTADEAIGSVSERDPSGKACAKQFLIGELSKGPAKVADLEREARAAGLLGEGERIGKSKPFRAAAEELSITKHKCGMNEGWAWALPKVPSGAEDAL